ncbi:MAG: signal transduction histidine kinase [Saprospiraceae bacterium]
MTSKIENGYLIVEIRDKGIGIPEEDQEHLFSRFFRATNATTIQGTDLGLTIVKRYLDLMKGTISFVSKENEGSAFRVEIPQ